MISSLGFIVLTLLVPAQSAEQAVELHRKASDLLGRGALEESLKIAEDLAKVRPDTEGLLRVRVGAGLEDREFEPRRLAGDACMALARKAPDPEQRARQIAAAERWYQASLDRGLKKSGPLLELARTEASRDRVALVRADVATLIGERAFEKAFARVDAGKQIPGVEALRGDVEAGFRRWQDGLLAELREDLKNFAIDARWNRYQVPPERASVKRLDPAILWASGLKDAKGLDSKADEAVALGQPYFGAVQEFILEGLAREIRDPGPSRSPEDRWGVVQFGEQEYSAAAASAMRRASRVPDGDAWVESVLRPITKRANSVRGGLPDRNAVKELEALLERLKTVAGAKADAYLAIENELAAILAKVPGEKGRIRAAQALARATALYLSGSTREETLARCVDLLREADPAALAAWSGDASPRVKWVFEQGRKP